MDIGISDGLEKPWKCADEGSSCECQGRVYFGSYFANDTGKEIKKFEDLLHWKFDSKYTKEGESMECSAKDFGQDPWPGQNKQCFCEPGMGYQPNHCAAQGGECKCPKGSVFFARKYREGTKKIEDLEHAIKSDFSVVQMKDNSSVTCMATSFQGVEPLPGVEKDCYCDWKNSLMDSSEIKTN